MMAGRYFFIIAALLLSFACSVLADDDTSGNIRVEVTKLDSSLSYAVIAVICIVVVIAIALSIILLLRSRASSPCPSRAVPVLNLKPESSAGFKPDGYYDGVFNRHLPRVEVIDEKAPQEAVAAKGSGGARSNDVDRYLKEDERIVINVLRMKHSSCTQATIRVVTDFSKARLSRILSELEERGIIYKEQQGRKNLITLKE